MSSPQDLTTVAALKAWLAIPATNTASDPALAQLVTAVSRMICAYLSRPSLLPRAYAERYDGQGNHRILLRNWPVLSIQNLMVWNQVIAPANPPPTGGAQSGYLLSPWNGAPPGSMQWLDIYSSLYESWVDTTAYDRGQQSVSVDYTAGYAVQAEPATIPAVVPPATEPQVQPLAPFGPWASDLSVINASTGAPFLPGPDPAPQGGYSVQAGLYSFNSADIGTPVLLSYGYVPAEISEACMELCAERWTYRQRIGIRSQSLAGQESISFGWPGGSITNAGGPGGSIPAYLQSMIDPYRAVVVPLPA
jgi:hypothetical protein